MRIITIVLFLIYIAVLVKLVVLKGPFFYHVVSGTNSQAQAGVANETHYGVNLVPFRTIRSFMTLHASTSTEAKVFNLLGNVALFIPLGFFLPIIFKRAKRFWRVVSGAFVISLCFEVFQLITHTGHFDVDDLILNSLGGMIGYGCFLIVKKLAADNTISFNQG